MTLLVTALLPATEMGNHHTLGCEQRKIKMWAWNTAALHPWKERGDPAFAAAWMELQWVCPVKLEEDRQWVISLTCGNYREPSTGTAGI